MVHPLAPLFVPVAVLRDQRSTFELAQEDHMTRSRIASVAMGKALAIFVITYGRCLGELGLDGVEDGTASQGL